MAKGVLHLNVEFSAVADEDGRFARLATLLGLADADHARGKCEHLWVACTRRGEADLPQWLVEQVLGERGPEALLEAELGTWSAGRGDSKTRRMRIGGAAKHCLWMSSSKDQLKHEQRAKGGETRAKTSSRQLDGTFAPRPAEHPAPSSSSEITAEIFPEKCSPARDPAVPDPAPDPTARVSPAPVQPASDERVEIKRRLIGRAWTLGGEGFARVRASGIDPTAPNGWAGMPDASSPPMQDLRAIVDGLLVGDPPDFAAAEAKIANRIAVAEAEARAMDPPSARYLTPARIWNRKSFAIAVDLSPMQVTPRAGPRSSAGRATAKRDVRVGRIGPEEISDYGPEGEVEFK